MLDDMIRRLILLLACCVGICGCNGGGPHAASTTYHPTPFTTKMPHYDVAVPDNHGGFVGLAVQQAYDAAYALCYGEARAALASGDRLTTAIVHGGEAHATNKGCHDGTHAAWKTAGIAVVPPSATTQP
jgi:hypothetical protein